MTWAFFVKGTNQMKMFCVDNYSKRTANAMGYVGPPPQEILIHIQRYFKQLQMSIQALQDQLAQRPPIERIQELEKEYKNLDLILQGTLRENEKSMADMERYTLLSLFHPSIH